MFIFTLVWSETSLVRSGEKKHPSVKKSKANWNFLKNTELKYCTSLPCNCNNNHDFISLCRESWPTLRWSVSAAASMKLASQPTRSRRQISTPPTLPPMPPPPITPLPTTPLHTPLPLTQPIPAVGPTCSSSLPTPRAHSHKEMPATSRPATETKGGHMDEVVFQVICRYTDCSCTAQTQSYIILMWFHIWFNTLTKCCTIWESEQCNYKSETRDTAAYVTGSAVRS